MILGLFRALLPTIARLSENKPGIGKDATENVIAIFTIYNMFTAWTPVYLILLNGILDMKRINFLLNQT